MIWIRLLILILYGPAVDVGVYQIVPGAGAGGVLGQSGNNAVTPGFHVGGVSEFPSYGVVAGGSVSRSGLAEHVLGLGSALERAGAELVSHHLGAALAGYYPVHEVQSSLDIILAGLAVNGPAVFGAGAQAGLFFTLYTAVDGDHGQIVLVHAKVVYQGVVFPGTVLEEHGLALSKFSLGIAGGLAGQIAGRAGAVVDVKIPDVLEVVKILAGNGGGLGGYVVVTELIEQGQVGQMAAEAPRGGAVQTCAGERGEAEFVLAGGDVLNNSLKSFKVGDFAYLMAGLFKQGLVDYKTIGLISSGSSVPVASRNITKEIC